MTKRRARNESEFCSKCGMENNSEYTWLRNRAGFKYIPILCPDCAKTLSKNVKEFVLNWLAKNK